MFSQVLDGGIADGEESEEEPGEDLPEDEEDAEDEGEDGDGEEEENGSLGAVVEEIGGTDPSDTDGGSSPEQTNPRSCRNHSTRQRGHAGSCWN